MFAFDDNPTRHKIVMLLKKSEHMTVAALSVETGVTPMAVRQHLMSLEKKGIISYQSRKYGIGRPVFLYRLTDKAASFFPNAYEKFILDTLMTIREHEGPDKLNELFRLRNETLIAEKRSQMSNGSLFEKVRSLAELMDNDGHMVDIEDSAESFSIRQYNCLLKGVAASFPLTCLYELEFYRALLGSDVTRSQHMLDGHTSCTYLIPKA